MVISKVEFIYEDDCPVMAIVQFDETSVEILMDGAIRVTGKNFVTAVQRYFVDRVRELFLACSENKDF